MADEAEDNEVIETEDEEEPGETMVEADEAATEEENEGENDEEGEDDEELEAVAEENEKLMEELEKKEEKPPESETAKGKDNKVPDSEALKGKIDDKTMRELVQIEKEAKEAANQIYELKIRIEELLKKEKMTQEEEKELEEKNTQLKDLMLLFDAKTKQIQEIIMNTNILESIPVRIPQAKHEEDVLPTVIMLGQDDEYVPKIVVCNQKVKGGTGKTKDCRSDCPGRPSSSIPQAPSVVQTPNFNKSDTNEDIEKVKLQFEKDIADKNRLLEELHMKLQNLEKEIRTVATENAQLNDKIRKVQQDQMRKMQPPCQPNKMSQNMLAARLKEYENHTRELERTVAMMEEDFDRVHREICAAMKERDRMPKNSNMVPPCRRR